MISKGIKLSFVIVVILSLLLSTVTISASFGIAAAQKRQVTLTTILDDLVRMQIRLIMIVSVRAFLWFTYR
ncbi:MAG: hypothetical protein ACJ705_10480 [Nitrososphaeraceae archaeon]|jgi:hypothetical protein